MDDIYAGARPGRGHRAVARWAAAGLVHVVTQNIDGLHQAAGLPAATARRTARQRHLCARASAAAGATHSDRSAPASRPTGPADCACGGIVKSASIAFGQALDAGDVCARRRGLAGLRPLARPGLDPAGAARRRGFPILAAAQRCEARGREPRADPSRRCGGPRRSAPISGTYSAPVLAGAVARLRR